MPSRNFPLAFAFYRQKGTEQAARQATKGVTKEQCNKEKGRHVL